MGVVVLSLQTECMLWKNSLPNVYIFDYVKMFKCWGFALGVELHRILNRQ